MWGVIAAAMAIMLEGISAVDSTLSLGGRLAGLFRDPRPIIRARLGVRGAGTPPGWMRLRISLRSIDRRGWRVTALEFQKPIGLLLAGVPHRRITETIAGSERLEVSGPAVEPAGTAGTFRDEHSADYLVPMGARLIPGEVLLVVEMIDRERPKRIHRRVAPVELPFTR